MIALLTETAPLPPLAFSEKWSQTVPNGGFNSEATTLSVVGPRVYYYNEDSNRPLRFGCLELATGRIVWQKMGPMQEVGRLVAGEGFLVADTGHEVLQIDPKDGQTLWRAPRDKFRAGPLIRSGRLFYESVKGTLAAVDLAKHRPLWKHRYPFGLTTGFEAARVVGDRLLFATDDGGVAALSPTDGHVIWRREHVADRIQNLLPSSGMVLAQGDALVALRPNDGTPIWRDAESGGNPIDVPARGEIWSLSMEGLLTRRSAKTGATIERRMLFGDRTLGEAPIRYGANFLVYSDRKIYRLDLQGRLNSVFDVQENVSEMQAVGADLLVRVNGRIVRFRPGAEPIAANVDVLLAKAKRTAVEDRALIRIGRPLVPRLIGAVESAKGEAADALIDLLVQIADRRDTPAMLALAEKRHVFDAEEEGYPPAITQWLQEKADRNAVATFALPKLRASRGRTRYGLLEFVSLGTDGACVDEMLGLLRDPIISMLDKSVIYPRIAACGRADVLVEILKIRTRVPRLIHATPGLSATEDHDGDGIPDAFDANPLAAPRTLTDPEKAMAAAFDARFRFGDRTNRIGLISFGPDVRPFELTGWQGALVTEEGAARLGLKVPKGVRRSYPYPYLRLGPAQPSASPTIIDPKTGLATVDIGATYGGLDGTGFRATLRKFGGEWYCVDLQMTWVS